jgi:hypothetical protein
MRDDLIGYVMGALDAPHHDALRHRIENSKELQQQLRCIERSLRPLRWAAPDVDPPEGLAIRTIQRVGQLSRFSLAASDPMESALAGVAGPLAPRRDVAPVARALSGNPEALGSARRWTPADLFVAAGVCVAAACLFFPALLNSRYHADLSGCQNNMRLLGNALSSYSDFNGGYFPLIPAKGNLSFAGVYAPKLAEKGLVQDGRVFWCPAKGGTVVVKIPRLQDLMTARGPQLVTFHRTVGGDYAYTLGYMANGRLRGFQNRGRAQSALLADAPIERVRNVAIGSHGRGQNVLFEDGHVGFLGTRTRPGTRGDDLFLNDSGLVYAGLHAEDSVLAPSPTSPLPSTRD